MAFGEFLLVLVAFGKVLMGFWCVAHEGHNGTLGPIMIALKPTQYLNGTSLVGLLTMGAQKIPGFMLVNLTPNT